MIKDINIDTGAKEAKSNPSDINVIPNSFWQSEVLAHPLFDQIGITDITADQ
jgi:hypothetical protein